MKKMNRRDFLKLSGLVTAGTALTALQPRGRLLENKKPNIVILVADTMSAENLSLYGYGRHTTPNLERWAERGLVYHSHYSGGNFTTPGTASMLTGMYPWSHRALNLGGLVHRPLANQNIFHLLGAEYQRVGFAQNLWADLFLRQFGADVDEHIPSSTFRLMERKPLVSQFFKKDQLAAYYAIDDFLISTQHVLNPLSGSASLGYLSLLNGLGEKEFGLMDEDHPYGLPSSGYFFFKNSMIYDGVRETVLELQKNQEPFFAYIHLNAPHAAYCPTSEFVDSLGEIDLPAKPRHPLGGHASPENVQEARKRYDEYVANVDAEIGRLLDALDEAGGLENTYFIITSDHGELFERGDIGHDTPLLYNPVIHIPLLVIKPEQTTRQDIHVPTSNIDLLPTLLSIADQTIPDNLVGRPLPGLGGEGQGADSERAIFSVEAKGISAFHPLTMASIAMIKETKKLIHYRGYKKFPDSFELYDLQEDNQEKNDLYPLDTVTATRMKEELLDNFNQAERPFRSEK